MLGDFEARAPAAFLAQPLFIQLVDVDLDTSDAAEQVTLSVISRYKARTDDGEEEQNAFADKVAMRYQLRDRVDVTLIEQPNDANAGGPIRSGRFTGKVSVVLAHETQPADQADMELACLVEDEVYVTYTDNLHVYGDTPRTLDAMVTVAGEINNRPVASQDVVFDPVMRARKNLVEASAYLELARIFKSMGLMAGTIERAAEGVARVESVIRTDNRDVGAALKQDAFKTKWELHIEAGQLSEALATCAIFNQYYPDSPLVADALLGVGKINLEDKKYKDAVAVFEQITRLSSASMDIRAEAQFEIAKTLEIIFQESLAKMDSVARADALKKGDSASIQAYMACAQRYAQSPFAGDSLAKVIDYNIANNDLAQANSLLEQTFQDYPDASFLDGMLMKWVLVAFQTGDYVKARDKCNQLLLEYPESKHAETARKVLPRIESRLQ